MTMQTELFFAVKCNVTNKQVWWNYASYLYNKAHQQSSSWSCKILHLVVAMTMQTELFFAVKCNVTNKQ